MLGVLILKAEFRMLLGLPSSCCFSELVVLIPSSPLLLLDSPPFLFTDEASVSHRDKPWRCVVTTHVPMETAGGSCKNVVGQTLLLLPLHGKSLPCHRTSVASVSTLAVGSSDSLFPARSLGTIKWMVCLTSFTACVVRRVPCSFHFWMTGRI